MSETQVDNPKVITARRTQTINGVNRDEADVKVGDKTITFRRLDVVDTWNLAEVAPPNASVQWRNMALVTMAVTNIGPKAVLGHDNSVQMDRLRRTMRELGSDGLAAVAAGLAEMDPTPEAPENENPEAAHGERVGNFSESSTSGS